MNHTAPRWAASARRAMNNLRTLCYWWYDRQDPDTGIGFEDDDTESILVASPTLALCQDDQRARQAFRVLCEQMWCAWGMDGEKEVGYPTNIETGDIEHAAEPISFSQPTAMLVEPGNPINVERCLISARNLFDWTDINSAGHRHFKAFFFGAGGVKNEKYYDCDIPMNARAVIPAIYVAWYNRDPLLMRYLTEYSDAWVEHAMDTSMGKPLGVVPSEIRFSDDKVGAYSGRWDQIAGYRQFDWSAYHRSAYNMYYHFVAMYMLTGGERYLEPVRETIRHLASEFGVNDAAAYAAMYRNFTGLTDLDYLFTDLANRDPLWRWLLKNDTEGLADWCDAFSNNLETNMGARTVDLDLRDPCANYATCVDDSVLRLMFTGGLGYQVGAYPHLQVSWNDVDQDFAALVIDAGEDHMSVLVHDFGSEERTVQMVVWSLPKGEYQIEQRGVNSGSTETTRMRLARWSQVPIRLIPGVTEEIRIRQVAREQIVALQPDLALSPDDLIANRASPKPGDPLTLQVTVHNTGSAEARDVEIEARELPAGRLLWQETLGTVPSPVQLTPSRVPVVIPWAVGWQAEGIEISVASSSSRLDATAVNNVVRLPLDAIRDRQWVPNVQIHRDPPPPEHPREVVAQRKWATQYGDWVASAPIWSGIAPATLDHRMYSSSDQVTNRTEVRALYDSRALYVLFLCKDSDPLTLRARLTERDSRVWDDESIEVTIDPRHDHAFYYHLALNSLGTLYDAEMVSPFWNGDWQAEVSICPEGWTAKLTLPLETFGIQAEPGTAIGINFIRTNYSDTDRGDRQTSIWQKVPGWTLRPSYFGHLVFG